MTNVEPYFRSIYPILVMYCSKILDSAEDAEHVAVDAFVRVHNGNYSIKNEKELRQVIWPIAKNLCYDIKRNDIPFRRIRR